MKRGRSVAKARGGCQNCRDRKVKCDEALPNCQPCCRSGIECPGYKKPLRWSRKHELQSNGDSSATPPKRHRRSYQYQAIQEESGQSEYSDVFTGTSQPSPSLSSWMDLDLIGPDARSAYEDAASLMCHDISGATPALLGPMALFNQVPSLGSPDYLLPPEPINAETIIDNDPSPNEIISSANTSQANQSKSARGAGNVSTKQRDTGSRSLLHIFYRLSSPARYPPGLSDQDFVGYYFKHISRLISCFDSELNIFHSLVVNHWTTSSTISFTIQSMAIAHISNWYPYMAQLGIAKRSQAWRSLQRDLQLLRLGCIDLEKVLLSLTLLGISASWQHGTHLGLQYLYIARNLIIHGKLQGTTLGSKSAVEDLDDFWADTLVYWETLASFVDPVPIITFDGHGLPSLDNGLAKNHPTMPHPWTGVVTELYFTLAEIGRVWRRQKITSTIVNSDQHLASHQLDRRWLENLEQYLLAIEIPNTESIQDYDDPHTSKLHLIRTAEACKGVCLLEIYHLCPEIFYDRVNDTSTSGQLPFSISSNRFGSIPELGSCLGAIAIHCLDLILEVPLSSGASRLQPLLLVACASQLRLSDTMHDLTTDEEDSQQGDPLGTQDRYVAEERILALSRKFPQAPILRAMDIIKETWERLDGGEDAHWIGIMHEKELQTILG